MQQKQEHKFIEREAARIAWLKSLESQDKKRFFRSGFTAHDQTAGGFQRGGSYLVAARSGVGKTSYILSLAYRQARDGVKAYFANLEMGTTQMWCRLACIHDPTLNLRELIETDLSVERMKYLIDLSTELVNFSPLFFENSDFTSLAKAATQSIEPSSESILFVDYIGLFTMKGLGPQERYWLISESAKQLKLLARALDITVVSAVQLNRKIEDRKDKTPNLADLRDSGELENHADGVFALTRQDDRIDVDILKNRWGPLGSYCLRFDSPRAAIEEYD
ncbi:MAG: hypothetical protein HY695_13445 [Deltaproteobacteria bacterium]|nr:hypothetical protein [Deltaproteobacteria bacterium]